MLRMEVRGKQKSFTVLVGLYDHDFIGKICRLFLRYSYLCKIAGDFISEKKNSVKCLPGKVWFLKGDEGTFNISMHLFKQIYSNLEKKSPTISTQAA